MYGIHVAYIVYQLTYICLARRYLRCNSQYKHTFLDHTEQPRRLSGMYGPSHSYYDRLKIGATNNGIDFLQTE